MAFKIICGIEQLSQSSLLVNKISAAASLKIIKLCFKFVWKGEGFFKENLKVIFRTFRLFLKNECRICRV